MTQTVNAANLALRFAANNDQRKLPIPKYLRVCEVIMDMLDAGEISPGDKLPPELQLARLLPISLGTVQKAMNTLTSRGVLERLQGSGTFVCDHTSELHDLWHFRFIDTDGKHILPVYTNTISIEETAKTGPWSAALNGAARFVKITRHININHEFGAIGIFYLKSAKYAKLLHEPREYFDGVHLRNIIHQRFGMTTARVKVQVSARTLPDKICHWLSLKSAITGLGCQITGYDVTGEPVSFQHVFIPPNVPLLEIVESLPATDKI